MNVSWLSAGNGLGIAGIMITCAVIILTLLAFIITSAVNYYRRHRKKAMSRDNRRISVRNIIAVDESRRLVLIRRDHTEHLLLTGGNCDLLIESFPEGAASQTATDRSLLSFHEKEVQSIRKPGLKPGSRIETTNPAENAYIAKQQHLLEPNADKAEKRRHNMAEARPTASSAESQIRERAAASSEYTNSALRQKQNAATTAENKIEKPDTVSPDIKAPNSYAELHSESDAVSADQVNYNHHQSKIARNQTPQNNHLNVKEETNASALNGQKNDDEENVRQSQFTQQGQNGQNDTRPHDTYHPERSQAASAHNKTETDTPSRSSAGGIYAPYLGYIPKSAFPRKQPEMRGNNGLTNRARNSRIDNNNGNTAPASPDETKRAQHSPNAGFSPSVQGENTRDQQLKQRERNDLPQNAPNGDGQPRNTAKSAADISRMVQPSFNNRRITKNSDSSVAKPQNGRQNFRRIVTPTDDNDFDKILQDELLRAPNAIKFSPSQKK